MKRKSIIALIVVLAMTAAFAFTSCKAGKADEVYEGAAIYDLSRTPYNLGVKAEIKGKISSVRIGRNEIEHSYKNGVLVLSKDSLKTLNGGDVNIDVRSDGGRVVIPLIVADKVISTAEEFQNINDNLAGTYVLGNDIDLSSIEHFQPLGFFNGEEDVDSMFQGILDGNGHTVKNASVMYCSSTTSSKEAYDGNGYFTDPAHKMGDNIGLFQVIGGSGIVRNVKFSNIHVRARTIAGVVAGNCAGRIENCIIDENCRVEGGTHFYDDDCNFGAVAGIIGAGAIVENVISLTSKVTIADVFEDWGDDYIGQKGNGWDDFNDTAAHWRFAAVDKNKGFDAQGNPISSPTEKELDGNGSKTNGVYSFAGKVWGTVRNCRSLLWNLSIFVAENSYDTRPVNFATTHVHTNKPTSGDTDLGLLENCGVYSMEGLRDASLYSAWDTGVWTIENGKIPALKCPVIAKAE